MGRVKLKIQRLESLNNRQITYGKRKNGILKKAQELSVLCDIEIFLLMFSPNGKPAVFCGERSNIAEMVAKYAQLTPKERAKRRLESLETLKRNFKKVDQDVDIEEFLNASNPSVEDMRNQVALLKGQVGEVHKRLSWWANPDKIDDVEHLSQMENSLRDTLNRVRMQKQEKFAQNQLISFDCTSQSQNPMTFPVIPTGDQDCQTQSWLQGSMPQQMMLPNEPHFLTSRDMDCPRDPSFPNCSGFFGTYKPQDLDKAMPSKTERQDDGISIDDYAGSSYLRLPLGNGNSNGNGNNNGKTMAMKNERQDDGISVDDYAGSYVRLPLADQFPCPSYGNLSFPYMMDPGRDANFQPNALDYPINGNFELPRSVYNSVQHSLVPPPGSCAISMFNDNAYPQPPNQFNA